MFHGTFINCILTSSHSPYRVT